MDEGVLARKIEVPSDTRLLKDDAFGMKLGKGGIHYFKGRFGDAVPPDKVTKLQESGKAADHLRWHMPSDCGQIYL